MNKIMLALATVATLGLSTAAFAQNPTTSTREHTQISKPQAPVAHKIRVSHQTGGKKLVATHHRGLHRLHSPHYALHKGQKVVQHMAVHKTVRTKASS